MAVGSNELRLVASIDLTRVTRGIAQLRTTLQSSLGGSSLAAFNSSLNAAVTSTNMITANIRNIGAQAQTSASQTQRLSTNLRGILTSFAGFAGVSLSFERISRGFATIEDSSLRLRNVSGSAANATTRVFELSRAASNAGLSFAGLSTQLVALQQVTANAGFSPEQSLLFTQNILRTGRALSGTSIQGSQGVARSFERILTQQRLGSFELRPLLLQGLQEQEIIRALGTSQRVGERLIAGNVPIFEGGRAARVTGFPESEQIQRSLNEVLFALAAEGGSRLPADFETLAGSTNALNNSFDLLISALGNSTEAFPRLTSGITSLSSFFNREARNLNDRGTARALVGDQDRAFTPSVTAAAVNFYERFLQNPATTLGAVFFPTIARNGQTPGNQAVTITASELIQLAGRSVGGQNANLNNFFGNLTDEQREAVRADAARRLGRDTTMNADVDAIIAQAEMNARAILEAIMAVSSASAEEAMAEERTRERNRQAEIAIRGVSTAIAELTTNAIRARAPLEELLQMFLDRLLQTGSNVLQSSLEQSLNNIFYQGARPTGSAGVATTAG